MNETLASMFVFAGNNGSGKSTIRNLIIDRLGVGLGDVRLNIERVAARVRNGGHHITRRLIDRHLRDRNNVQD